MINNSWFHNFNKGIFFAFFLALPLLTIFITWIFNYSSIKRKNKTKEEEKE